MKEREKLAAAVELGRLGGLKGGPARKKKLSAKRRVEIARLAANVRWGNVEIEGEANESEKVNYRAKRQRR